jgi:outer membrane protein assembly factor BamB
MKSRAALLLTLMLSLPLVRAGDWPQWRGPNRDSISAEKLRLPWPEASPRVLWTASVGTGFSGVSISRSRAYTMGNTNGQDTVWCLDTRSGNAVWKHSYPAQLSPQWYEGGPGATPTVDGRQVFTISKWGDVFCFEAATGKIVWQRDLRQDRYKPNRWGYAGSPLIWRDLVILNAGQGGTALDRHTGRIVWSNGTNTTGYASPVLFRHGGKDTVLLFAQQDLVALDPQTGRELWRYRWKTDWDTNNTDPLVHGDTIAISSFSRGCALLSLKTGRPELVYDRKTLFNNLSPGLLWGDYLYAFSGEAKKETDFRCLHLPTGDIQWTRKEPAYGSTLMTQDHLLVLTEQGELQVFGAPSAGGGPIPNADPIARAALLPGTCWTPPSLANGRLYVRNAHGTVKCVSLK